MNKKVLILTSQSGDWEGLFIEGKLIDEGHQLGEGNRLFMLEMAEKFNFRSTDVNISEVDDVDEDYLREYGSFPELITELNGIY